MRTPLFVVMLAVGTASSARSDTLLHVHHHEAGVDVTAFLRQFLSWGVPNGDNTNYLLSPWVLSYRYHLKHWNLRFGVGGMISDVEQPDYSYSNPTETTRRKQTELDLRVGAERYQELSKRWQVFYGLDFRPSWQYSQNDYHYSNGGYRYGSDSRQQDLAFAPLLGLRYHITKRFSLHTETSFAFMRSDSELHSYTVPIVDGYPPLPDTRQRTGSFRTVFQTPLSVIATFDL